jgi:cardiolipin synthase (CMP-forming)
MPLWLVLLTVARDLAILCAGLYAFCQRLKIKFQPIMVSKLNTFLQILLIGVTLLFHSQYTISVLLPHYFTLYQGLKFILYALIAGCAITTLWSWWRYGVYFIQELKIQKKDSKNS